ncbi:hypothetical protein B0H14DRAFT_3171353 [Mycena olivaceomarginata]|nr:hypothetical protein B0H14DRAFT_3171353 [Mycena olivaceomarginata]
MIVFCPPFIQCIANTTETLINMIQLMENIHPVLYAIINLHLKAETVEPLSPAMLNNIGKFMDTTGWNRIKHLFRNNEIQKLFKDCHAGLDQAVEVFEITTKPAMFSEIDAIKKTAQLMHEELLELIQTLSDASTDSGMSSPKIFHGREFEVDNIMKMLGQVSPRIAILGGGGMGKTSLARAVLHHPDTCDKFELWEPMQSRGGIEEFLSLLAGVKHLALIITMRGAERPAKVHWTHPFLLPLQPLSDDAARQTFVEITDNVYDEKDIAQILRFTDNMPLVVDLIAHLADYEGLSNVLARWETERTALISVGHDRKSNLDVSISLSLSSPRITSESKELLSLLSILPDGLSDAELVQSKLPVRNILSCKTALLATSLAYQDSKRRLRSLMPVREHVQQFLPPSPGLIQCLRKLFYALLELYYKYNGEQLGPVINQITLNLVQISMKPSNRGYTTMLQIWRLPIHRHIIPELILQTHWTWLYSVNGQHSTYFTWTGLTT